jgi:hypothetical protein
MHVLLESGMSITVELPPEMEERIRQIPDLNERVAAFLRDQADYEAWRARRYNAKARALAEESLAEAEQLKAQGVGREELFRRFFDLHDRITRAL